MIPSLFKIKILALYTVFCTIRAFLTLLQFATLLTFLTCYGDSSSTFSTTELQTHTAYIECFILFAVYPTFISSKLPFLA